MSRKRLRELNISIGKLQTGENNNITDVAGVLIGHHTIKTENVCSGVTVILPNNGKLKDNHCPAGFFSFNGTGEFMGTHWIKETGTLITPIVFTGSHLLGQAHQHLAKATRKIENLEPFSIGTVGETWDGWLSDLDATNISYEEFASAVTNAKSGKIEEGNVGGGTGMICFEFKGGIGSSSRIAECDCGNYTVGALVQTNFGRRQDLVINGVQVGGKIGEKETALPWHTPDNKGSLLVSIATDAPLLPLQCERLSKRASLAFARLGSIGEEGSGDFFITFSTGNTLNYNDEVPSNIKVFPNEQLDSLFEATIEAVEEAILNSMTTASTQTGQKGRTVHEIPLKLLTKILE